MSVNESYVVARVEVGVMEEREFMAIFFLQRLSLGKDKAFIRKSDNWSAVGIRKNLRSPWRM